MMTTGRRVDVKAVQIRAFVTAGAHCALLVALPAERRRERRSVVLAGGEEQRVAVDRRASVGDHGGDSVAEPRRVSTTAMPFRSSCARRSTSSSARIPAGAAEDERRAQPAGPAPSTMTSASAVTPNHECRPAFQGRLAARAEGSPQRRAEAPAHTGPFAIGRRAPDSAGPSHA
jgi:hypothetical protein